MRLIHIQNSTFHIYPNIEDTGLYRCERETENQIQNKKLKNKKLNVKLKNPNQIKSKRRNQNEINEI